MKHYFNNGAGAYMYWNISLSKGGFSRWGWQQNSLVTVDTVNKTFQYNHEYYLMKHLSHYVKPGAKFIKTVGKYNNLLAFRNPDESIVLVTQNPLDQDYPVRIKLGNRLISANLKGNSFNTILLKKGF
jgi:glucosylceramidase